MNDTTQTLTVFCSRDAGTAIRRELDAIPGSKPQMMERKNLDGSPPDWIAIAQLAKDSLLQAVALLATYVASRKVRRIKIRDGNREIEIENPTPEQVEALFQQIKGPA